MVSRRWVGGGAKWWVCNSDKSPPPGGANPSLFPILAFGNRYFFPVCWPTPCLDDQTSIFAIRVVSFGVLANGLSQ